MKSRRLLIGVGTSNLGVAKYLAARGERFLFHHDSALSAETLASLNSLGGEQVILENLNDLPINELIASPSCPPTHELIRWANANQIPVGTELDFAFDQTNFDLPVVAITGTNGKSTVCQMVAEGLAHLGYLPSIAAGNIGTTLIESIGSFSPPRGISLELSSYQLHYARSIKTDAAIITNLTPDHIAWHGCWEDYIKAKHRIIQTLKPGGVLVTTTTVVETFRQYQLTVPNDAIILTENTAQPESPQASLDNETLHWRNHQITLKLTELTGNHNLLNAAMASLAILQIPGNQNSAIKAICATKPLPYRSQLVRNTLGITIVNDSKSTNVASTMALLSGSHRTSLLLLGGKPKGESFAPLTIHKDFISKVFAFGEAGPQIKSDLDPQIEVVVFRTCKQMLVALVDRIKHNEFDNVLFSPACASFDEFKNFEDRGAFFSSFIDENLKSAPDFGSPE